jgi:hypothetical protein
MNRRSFAVALGATAGIAFGAEDPSERLEEWRQACIKKDVGALDDLLHEHLLFGHSDGRLESKEDFISGVTRGKVVYEKIVIGTQTQVNNRDTALLRGEMTVSLARDGVKNTFRLNVLHVWIYEKRRWRLVGRQATRLA